MVLPHQNLTSNYNLLLFKKLILLYILKYNRIKQQHKDRSINNLSELIGTPSPANKRKSYLGNE